MVNMIELISDIEEQLALIREAKGQERDLRTLALEQYLKGLKKGLEAHATPKPV